VNNPSCGDRLIAANGKRRIFGISFMKMADGPNERGEKKKKKKKKKKDPQKKKKPPPPPPRTAESPALPTGLMAMAGRKGGRKNREIPIKSSFTTLQAGFRELGGKERKKKTSKPVVSARSASAHGFVVRKGRKRENMIGSRAITQLSLFSAILAPT